MKAGIHRLCLVAAVLLGLIRSADAAVWAVDCSDNPTAALGAVVGTATAPGRAADGDVVLITGLCREDVRITQDNLLLGNRTGMSSLSTGDGIAGQVEFAGGTGDKLVGLLLGWPAPGNLFASPDDEANLRLRGDATLTVTNCAILNGPASGLSLADRSWAQLIGTTVSANGTAAGAPDNAGIRLGGGASLVLGNAGAAPVMVTGNGGAGVLAQQGNVVITAAVIADNGGAELSLTGGASAVLSGAAFLCGGTWSGGVCNPNVNAAPALVVLGSSSVRIMAGVAVTGGGASPALLIGGASVALLQNAVISAQSTSAVIEATSGSAVELAGGNLVCAGILSGGACAADGGLAIQADHVSSLLQLALPATAAADQIIGASTINEQSNADLGGGAASLSWTTGPGQIRVQQNSSFRLSGGAAIAGPVMLEQGSNGFFNTINGGQNGVSHVACPFGARPASHLSQGGPATLSPPAVTTAAPAASSNQCMPF